MGLLVVQTMNCLKARNYPHLPVKVAEVHDIVVNQPQNTCGKHILTSLFDMITKSQCVH